MDEPSPPSRRLLADTQLDRLAEYFLDLSKLLVASVIVGFFVPGSTGEKIDAATFLAGTLLALIGLVFGIRLTPKTKI